MKRAEVVSLLKDILRNCESFGRAQAVSIDQNYNSGEFMLCAQWVPAETERPCIDALMVKYKAKSTEAQGYIIFS